MKILYHSTIIITIFFTATILFSPVVMGTSSNNTTQAEYDKQPQINDCLQKGSVRNNNSTAINLAQNSNELKSKIQGFSYQFNSIFNIFHYCKLQTVNVVFTITDSNGNFMKNVVVTEDSSLTKILNVSEQQGAHYGSESSTQSTAYPKTISGLAPLPIGVVSSTQQSFVTFVTLGAIIAGSAIPLSIFVLKKKK